MGMYDTIYVKDDPRFTCEKGHPVKSLQTKDLDCELESYTLTKGKRIAITGSHSAIPKTGCLEGDWELNGLGCCEECIGKPSYWVDFTLIMRNGVVTEVRRHEQER
jgi:hypothetical protein